MKALQQLSSHWGWLYLSLIQAVCSAHMGSQKDTAHWWELAAERGLDQIHSEDLRLPLEALHHEVKRRGWDELTAFSEGQLKRLR